MPGEYVQLRGRSYFFNRAIPFDLRHHYSGATSIRLALKTRDYDLARRKASRLAFEQDERWFVLRAQASHDGSRDSAVTIYHRQLPIARQYLEGRMADDEDLLSMNSEAWSTLRTNETSELERRGLASHPDYPALTPLDRAVIDAKNDEIDATLGLTRTVRPQYDKSVGALVPDYIRHWKREYDNNRRGRLTVVGRETNTFQQIKATLDLFALSWGLRPIRRLRTQDAADFVDVLKGFSPHWARSGAWQSLDTRPSWIELVRDFGGHPEGLSASTINRHVRTLAAFWNWARVRGHCTGTNPFEGHTTRINVSNTRSYETWQADEIRSIIATPPRRKDLYELFVVLAYSGMRASEAADLTWGRIRQEGDVSYFQIDDAKTKAGVRKVPVHPKLLWLLEQSRRKDDGDAVWPTFNPESRAKKRGADASRLFSDYKVTLGFTDRQKALHSLRHSFITALERNGTPESVVQQLVGHIKAFSFRVYSDGVTLAAVAEAVSGVAYDFDLPDPSVIYGDTDRLPGLPRQTQETRRSGLT